MESARPALGLGFDHRRANVIELRGVIEANLRAFSRVSSPSPQRPAAVAVVLVDLDGEPSVPIFQRTAEMSRHPGQMALPGGRLHQGETVEACAIRELHEELGLEVAPDGVLGALDDFDTRSGFTITPVVIWSGTDAGALVPSTSEVAHLFVVPVPSLRAAADDAGRRPSGSFSLRLPSVEVFAPTAAMLYQFSEVALAGRTVRVADFYQPPWTHR